MMSGLLSLVMWLLHRRKPTWHLDWERYELDPWERENATMRHGKP